MSSRDAGQTRPELALNAIRLALPEQAIPAAVIPFERSAFHGFLDRPKADVFAIRQGDTEMAVVPLLPDADLPAKAIPLAAAGNLRLVATLAREAVFHHLLHLPGNYRIVRRRPPEVETAKQENIIPGSLGLPEWLKKRVVLRFETRIIKHPGEEPYVILTCANRLRTVISANCRELHDIGVPLIGNDVSVWVDDPDPKVAQHLRYAGRVISNDGLAVTCVPKVPIWKMRDFSGLCCACARISLISR